MRLKVRGRHTEKDVFKPGERCHRTGRYRCDTCHRGNRKIEVDVSEGAIFPMCEDCPDWDMGWRLTH